MEDSLNEFIEGASTLERMICATILVGTMFLVGFGLSNKHREKMQNDPKYKQEYLEDKREAYRTLNEFAKKAKWCYGR